MLNAVKHLIRIARVLSNGAGEMLHRVQHDRLLPYSASSMKTRRYFTAFSMTAGMEQAA